MTDHHVDEEASKSEQNVSPKWLWWPGSFVVAAVTLVFTYQTAVAHGLGNLYLIVCGALVLFYGFFLAKFLIRFLSSVHRNLTKNKSKVRNHDHLVDELAKWKTAAGEATARAADAEARLATWNRSTLEEGRRRLAGEIAARGTETSFGPIEWGERDEALVCGALWSGEIPMPGARYILRTKMIKGIRAVLEVQAIQEDKTVIFSVESFVSAKYRANLLDSAQSGKPFAGDVEIVPRDDDQEMGKEALWPEN